ncbi:MAG: sugar transferase [Hyphomicrobiaceae bacterium]
MAKRFFEISIAATVLLLTAPILLVFAIAIWFESRGSFLLVQDRVGQYGELFRCYKLRTMHLGAPVVPTHDIADCHLTRIGKVLRRTGFDELPQLWNVLNGSMSFVGPRPCLPMQTDLVAERKKFGVLSVRPGITGLAQVNQIDMSDPSNLVRADVEYVDTQSLTTDLRIILDTVGLTLKKALEFSPGISR